MCRCVQKTDGQKCVRDATKNDTAGRFADSQFAAGYKFSAIVTQNVTKLGLESRSK